MAATAKNKLFMVDYEVHADGQHLIEQARVVSQMAMSLDATCASPHVP